jgi:hypothetical protein
MYGESEFQDFANRTGNKSRAEFEKILQASYSEETGAGARIDIKRLHLNSKGDLDDLFKGSSYDVVIYDGHGSSKKKELLPGGNVTITPEDLKDALAGQERSRKRCSFTDATPPSLDLPV